MNPNMDLKTELTLSAGPELDGYNSCSPDDYPPYERVPPAKVLVHIGAPLTAAESTFIGHTIAWIVFGLLVVNVAVQVFR